MYGRILKLVAWYMSPIVGEPLSKNTHSVEAWIFKWIMIAFKRTAYKKNSPKIDSCM